MIRNGLVYVIDWMAMDCVVVGSAGDGHSGLELIEETDPDIVITDIRMPGLDGLSMLEAARSDQYDFSAIIISSYSDFEYAQKAIRTGVLDYMLKPIDEDELVAKINEAKRRLRKKRILHLVDDAFLAENSELFERASSAQDQDPYTSAIISMIKDHYHEKLTLTQIATELNVSPSFVSRYIKEKSQFNFTDLLNRYRLQKALTLMLADKHLISEVAERCGFSDYRHFNTVFRKYLGISPSKWLKDKGLKEAKPKSDEE
ncbi:MAG: response regulator [Eubacteriales bacterium]|nr:response regulator [Eubacteriales bacterium]